MSDIGEQKRRRGRRPAAQVRSEVLDATGTLLLAEGLHAVTFERIAKEAGASKTTLYKWWPSPGALAAEAFFARSEPVLEFTDTGDLYADLVAQLSAFVELLGDDRAGRPISELIGAAQLDPALASAWTNAYSHPRRDLALERLDAAKQSGEIHAEADLEIMVDQLWGACYHRLLILKTPLTEIDLGCLVAQCLRGVQ